MTKFGPITFYQNGSIADELNATAGIADHAGWRGYTLDNVDILLRIKRDHDIQNRYFADMKCVIRFPEFKHESRHNAMCDIPTGQAIGDAVVRSYAIALNFKEPHNTLMEVEFNLGAGALETAVIPIKYNATVAA